MSITWIFLCPRFGQECFKILFLTRKWVLHGYFHVPVLIKNVWNYLLFFAHKWVLHEYFHVPVFIKKCLRLFCVREWALCAHGKFHGLVLAKGVWNDFLRVNGITWKLPWIFLVRHYYIEIVNTADKFSSLINSSTF